MSRYLIRTPPRTMGRRTCQPMREQELHARPPPFLEVDLRAHLDEARLQHRGRRQPRRRRRRERLVITQHRRAVEDIVDVDTEVRPPTAETDVLRDSQVELVD